MSLKLLRRAGNEMGQAIDIASSGRLALATLVTHQFSLDDAPAAFEKAARRDGLKVVITP